VSIAGGRVEFKHPLVRAVTYRAARGRRAAHRALAHTVTGPDAPLRRAWHALAGSRTGAAIPRHFMPDVLQKETPGEPSTALRPPWRSLRDSHRGNYS